MVYCLSVVSDAAVGFAMTRCYICVNLGGLVVWCSAFVSSVRKQWKCTGAVLWYQDAGISVSADTVLYLCKPGRLGGIVQGLCIVNT